MSKIITSDDVFNHIIEVRERNENLNFKRELIFKEKPKWDIADGKDHEGLTPTTLIV